MSEPPRHSNDFRPTVSIVIPTLDGGEEYRATLAKILAQDYAPRPELCVVDSGSTDGSVDWSKEAGAHVISIDRKTFNHGRARNLGIANSSGEIIALLSQDAEPLDEGWLAALVRNYADPRVAGVYSRQIPRPDCSPILKDRLESWSAGRTERKVQEPLTPPELADLAPLQRLERCAFDDVSSSVRRAVWEEHPFEERRFGEDVAWGKAVLLAGHAIVFEPEATVIHSHELSTWYEFRRIYADHANLKELFDVHTIPDRAALRRAFRHQRRHYAGVLRRLDLSVWQRWRLRAHSIPYAFLENLAQYFGARSARKLREGSRFYTWLDRRLRRGV